MARLLLADGSSQIYRAFHAMARGSRTPLTAPDGTPTGALVSFLQVLRKALRVHEPTLVAVTFDRREKTFRHELFPEYKAQREAMPEDLAVQLDLAHQALAALGLPVVEAPGYEADDVIATLTEEAVRGGHEVVILTGDKDLLQLVRPGVVLDHTGRDEVLDVVGATEYFGAPPEQVADVLALQGDASDNVPGVRGIGKKGARDLVRLHGGVEALLASPEALADDERLGPRRKSMARALAEHADEARLSRRLVGLVTDLALETSVEALVPAAPDRGACSTLFTRLGLMRLMEDMGLDAGEPTLRTIDDEEVHHVTVDEADGLRRLVGELREAGRMALDTETDSPNPHAAHLVGLAVGATAGRMSYVPVGHAEGRCLTLERLERDLPPLLGDPAVEKVGQNLKFDMEVLARHGLPVEGPLFDTMVASYLLEPARRSHSLDHLAGEVLSYRPIAYEDVAGKGAEQVTLDQVSIAEVARYCSEDADIALRLAEVFEPQLEAAGLMELFRDIEMPLVPVLVHMELTGVRVDPAVLEELSVGVDARLGGLTKEIHGLAGREFNVSSPKQLAGVLFDELGLKPRGRTAKTGARSTSVEVLEQLAAENPLPGLVLEHRELSKLKGTYLDALRRLVNPETGRVHTSYNQSVAATGRLSSSDPNLQNIPVRTELGRQVRRAFVAAPGCLLVGADYSQVELRVMAHVSEDEALIAAFERDEDIHAATAGRIFGVDPGLVTPAMRSRAKEVNFGVLYGMTAHGLAARLRIPRREAQDIIDRYFDSHPGVRRTVQRLIEECRESPRHEARTLFGRVRHLPEIASRNASRRAFAERAAVNSVIQGTAADLMKLAMIGLHARLTEEEPEARLILQVHDELVVEAPAARAEVVMGVMTEAMETVHPMRVPLKVAASTGESWYELK